MTRLRRLARVVWIVRNVRNVQIASIAAFCAVFGVGACHNDTTSPPAVTRHDAGAAPRVADAAAAVAPAGDGFHDLAAALAATIPADARVIGFGELHARTDRIHVTSALARFTTDALPGLAPKLSDLVVETWVVDPHCGASAQEATAKLEITVRRPQETTSEIGALADAARKAGVQPHAMRLTCDDYTRISPPGKPVDIEAMLTLTTRELGRISSEAVAHRATEPSHRPWIALYGGALHNDRFPAAGVGEWSYAAKLDAATANHFVEIDLIVPELAQQDPASQKEPWFGLADHPTIWSTCGSAASVRS